MIAVVTSTVKPADGINAGLYSYENRLLQTKKTLTQLQQHGFEAIYMIDNSPSLDQSVLLKIFADFNTVKFYHVVQYQFANKGINELLMLLYISDKVVPNVPVFKISGRYSPTSLFNTHPFADFAVKGYDFYSRSGVISTRGYWVKDAGTLQRFLLSCLQEIFAYPQRITGIRSFINKACRAFFNKKFSPVNISVEFAAANVLKKEKYKVTQVTHMGIEGMVAGSDKLEQLTE